MDIEGTANASKAMLHFPLSKERFLFFVKISLNIVNRASYTILLEHFNFSIYYAKYGALHEQTDAKIEKHKVAIFNLME